MSTPNINTILRDRPVAARYGAPMGSRDINDSTSPLLLQRITFVDGDYSADGTYWGGDSPLWCAFNAKNNVFDAAMGTRIWVRAKDRAEALALVAQEYPDCKFRRMS